MPLITHEIYIETSPIICFDLARNVEVHTQTTARTKEKAVGGVMSGLLKKGDIVTWEATHFGVKQRLTAEIIAMDIPYSFTDIMVKGAFHSFNHKHEFIKNGTGTVMKDRFDYKAPLGILGKAADKLFLERYMRKFIISRAVELKKLAERS